MAEDKRIWQAGSYTVRLADPLDAQDLGPRLRASDMMECFATGQPPITALYAPFECGAGPDTFSLEKDGLLIGMGGIVVSDGPSPSAVWFLGSDEVDEIGVRFSVMIKSWIDWCLTRSPRLHNVIPARDERRIRWLRSMGFDIGNSILHFHGIPFRRFRLERKDGPNSASAP